MSDGDSLRPSTAFPTRSGMRLSFLIWFPIGVVAVCFKMVRLHILFKDAAPILYLDAIKSDLFFYFALLFLSVALLSFSRRLFYRVVILLLMNTMAISSLLIETASHNFFIATRSVLDFPLITYFLRGVGEVMPVIGSEVRYSLFALFGLLAFYVIIITFFVKLRGHSDAKRPGWLVLSLILIAAAFVHPISGRLGTVFVENSTLHLLCTAVYQGDQLPEGKIKPMVFPTKSRLIEIKGKKHYNIIFIILESTRASATTPYNPALKTTPFLESWVKSSLKVERAYTVVPHTSKALVAILSGVEPNPVMRITEALPHGIPGKALPELLRERGYRTGYFQSATRYFEGRETLVRNLGFDTYQPMESMSLKGFEKTNYFGYEENIMLEPSRSWLMKNVDRPFLLVYMTSSTHHQYIAPKRYGHIHFSDDTLFNGYLNCVRYTDYFIHNIVEMTKDLNLYDRTIFIVLGDHGEAFLEHGKLQHDNVLYDETLKIPLIIHHPELFRQGIVIKGPVNQLDLLPTVTEMAGFSIKGGDYRGSSMLHPLDSRYLMAHTWYPRRGMAWVHGDFKYIFNYDTINDEYYNVVKDPFERHNLIGSIGNRVHRNRERLMQWNANVRVGYENYSREVLSQYVRREPFPGVIGHPIAYGRAIEMTACRADVTEAYGQRLLKIRTFFHVIKRPPGKLQIKMRVHPRGLGVRYLDHDPVYGLYPIRKWREGDYIMDVVAYDIPRTWGDRDLKITLGFKGNNKSFLHPVGVQSPASDGMSVIAVIRGANPK